MKKENRLKNQMRRGRLGKSIKVNLRWTARRIRRFFGREQFRSGVTGSYAKRLYVMLGLMVAVGALAVASSKLSNEWLADEAVLVRRLSDPNFNQSNPILSALNCFGSSNRIQVTLTTDTVDNLNPAKVHLERGTVNLVMTLKDGNLMEYTLRNRRIDNFEGGNTDQFTLILPDTVSVFDIAEYKLTLMPDAQGNYGSWRCRSAEISFLLGGERTTLAKEDWSSVFSFSKDNPSAVLNQVSLENEYYNQISELYPYMLKVCQNGYTTVHDKMMKAETLRTLGMGNGDVLYLDVETVGLENQNLLLREQMGTVELSEYDLFDYDGTMTLRVRFYSDAAGSYYKDYALDTPGKDDFELGSSSEFALIMPDGMSVFDIRSMELLVHDARDAWAPRMIRAYLKTDYGFVLELARETDVTLAEKRGTSVFYEGLIETEISALDLDLTASNQLPVAVKESIEKKYITEISGVTYSMYFNEFNFYERQKLFYSQMLELYGKEEEQVEA
ncbi:MAG: hypothetical protein IJ333_05360 [Clostridia bacterium]|nr:hypothetical protein [Clostridia bacterium]